MLNVGVVGATGYAGEELIGLLLKHPNARITNISSRVDKPKAIADIYPKFKAKTGLFCKKIDVKELAADCDLVFLALPHTVSMDIVPQLLKQEKRVIDLSADYRLKNAGVYEKFYLTKHKDKLNLPKAIYGLPELCRNKIKTAQLIANPGCYPTASILSLAPLLAVNRIDPDSIIIDAKSGLTGAGRKLTEGSVFAEINEDFKAYKVNVHQHAPEIDQELSKLAGKKIKITFVPHLLPLNRGILVTAYVNKCKKESKANVIELYKKFYNKEPFVRIREEGYSPRLKDVVMTNFCDIAIKDEPDKIIIIAVIDNLLKGAAGQAVQNMNVMYGFPENTAL
jgi:N-acetyl-gamma-glutamyl-phosphate reductase